MAIFVSTTGSTIQLGKELGFITIKHPTINLNLLDYFTRTQLVNSDSLNTAVSNGSLLLIDDSLNSITDLNNLKSEEEQIVVEAFKNFKGVLNITDPFGYGINVNGRPLAKILDVQKSRTVEYWSTADTEWDEVASCSLTTNNIATADYEVNLSMPVLANSNKTEFEFSVFVNGKEEVGVTRNMYFDRKNDTKSVTIISYIENVAPNSSVVVKARRISSKNGYVTMGTRSFIIKEI